jgi:hypothetical protein
MFFLALLGLPIAYAVVVIALFAKKERRGIALSVICGALAIATAIWSIDQSRSSTAGIAFLGIPLMGAVGGFLGLAFGVWRSSPSARDKLVAWIGLLGFLLLIFYNIRSGAQEISKNRSRDDKQALVSAEIARDRDLITNEIKTNPGRARQYLDSSIRARRADRSFLIAALPNDSISPELLDTLEAIRNPGTSSETLSRVYKTASYPDYFFQALAAHHHTPPEILSDLYHRQRTITGLDIWFAGNPSTPPDILDTISRTTKENYVVAQLIENPALGCKRLSELGVRLAKQPLRDQPDANVLRITERLPTVCGANATQ